MKKLVFVLLLANTLNLHAMCRHSRRHTNAKHSFFNDYSLKEAVDAKYVEQLQKLFDNNKLCDRVFILKKYHGAIPLLHYAVLTGNLTVAKWLLEHGFDPNFTNAFRYPDDPGSGYPETALEYVPARSDCDNTALIHSLVLHGGQLYEPFGNAVKIYNCCVDSSVFQDLQIYLKAPRVAPLVLPDWPLVKERLVTMLLCLRSIPHRIPEDIKTMLCEYTVRAQGPYLLAELCYLAQRGVVDKNSVVKKLTDAHLELLHESFTTKLIWDFNEEQQTAFQFLHEWQIENSKESEALKRLLNPDPENIRKEYSQEITAMYTKMLHAKVAQ